MAAGEPILYSLYVYAPNKGAPIFFAVAYALSAGFHIWQCYRYKAFKLIGLHPICAVNFAVGYALREYGAYNYLYQDTTKLPLILFVISQVLIYIGPPLLELANYHVLGRMFYFVPHYSPLPPNRVLITFGGLMGVVELLNSLGIALASNTSSSRQQQTLGGQLIVAATGIQVGIIVIFFCLTGIFHRRCARVKVLAKRVNTVLVVLYASMSLIFVRCIYRLVEHTEPTKVDISDLEALRKLSPLRRYEVYFHVFEAAFMLVNSGRMGRRSEQKRSTMTGHYGQRVPMY
ncbi:related to Rtm1p [Cephalotrichum gorgonifer]|uniref:Related to Rtm1p n=1 Tax=Cephalotrichum gorgonifer TaxID=2041049 RepID=A0AAE8MXD7_9PEZI|nr:related to Rtm1p [Cephalotrichum gorgonifer]